MADAEAVVPDSATGDLVTALTSRINEVWSGWSFMFARLPLLRSLLPNRPLRPDALSFPNPGVALSEVEEVDTYPESFEAVVRLLDPLSLVPDSGISRAPSIDICTC